MDGQRFDTLAKAFASSTSRRQAITAGGVGFAASLLSRGPRPSAAARQCSDAELTVCVTEARNELGVDLHACADRTRDEGTKLLIERAAEAVLQIPITGPIIAAIVAIIAAIILIIQGLIDKTPEKNEQKCVERAGEFAVKRIDHCVKRQGCPDGTRCCNRVCVATDCCTDADCADGTTCQGGQCVDRRP